ncbi:hypothetical protein CPB84DRAFT_961178 [Gymnopilus junonius]|uniref:HMG box domain-containing protein n=1 Tax=Gymnopilus junonius TaxID=109634 RepID=A0A9P5NLQ7_GYMJU|nr:hypothetical protein CPB84DRAFT_961178 [Gymnopilus junonius]
MPSSTSERVEPPRPPNKYILFRKWFLKTVDENQQKLVSKLAAKKWHSVGNDSELHQYFEKLAAELKSIHSEIFRDYKYKPKKKGKKKRTSRAKETSSATLSVQAEKAVSKNEGHTVAGPSKGMNGVTESRAAPYSLAQRPQRPPRPHVSPPPIPGPSSMFATPPADVAFQVEPTFRPQQAHNINNGIVLHDAYNHILVPPNSNFIPEYDWTPYSQLEHQHQVNPQVTSLGHYAPRDGSFTSQEATTVNNVVGGNFYRGYESSGLALMPENPSQGGGPNSFIYTPPVPQTVEPQQWNGSFGSDYLQDFETNFNFQNPGYLTYNANEGTSLW